MKILENQLYDSLTKLPNRRHLLTKLNYMKDNNNRFLLLKMDIDNFSVINTVYGEKTGDIVLYNVAQRIRKVAKRHYIARMGNDEFGVIVNNYFTKESIYKICKKIQSVVNNPILVHGKEINITLSIGVSESIDNGEVANIIGNAALALKESKKKKNSSISFYSPSMKEENSKKLILEKKLYQALQNKEIYVEYQPKFSLATKKVIGVEALARWTDEEYGYIPPLV